MQVTETETDGLKRELKVVIEADDLNQRLSARLNDLKDRIRLKGFRPGKVPLAHLKKVYGRSLMVEVVEQAVAESSQKVITDREERPAYQPEIAMSEDTVEIEKVIDGDADLAYTMAFEILPDIEIADFTKFSLEKPVAEIADADIDEAVAKLVEANVSYTAKDGSSAEGDKLKVDFVGDIAGEPFEGGTADDVEIVLGRGRFIPGFEEALKGAEAGETRTFETTFPDDYPVETLAGKTANFNVDVKEVAGPVQPEVGDDFAKTLGLDSLDALREVIAKQLGEECEAAARSKVKRVLLDTLNDAHTFDLPVQLVDKEFDAIWEQMTDRLTKAGKTFEDEDTTEDEARKEYRDIAERRVRLGLVLAQIGDEQEMSVSEEEVKAALMERIQQFPGQERQVFEFYQNNPAMVAELRAPIFEDKVVNYVLELASVTEKKVSREELLAPDE